MLKQLLAADRERQRTLRGHRTALAARKIALPFYAKVLGKSEEQREQKAKERRGRLTPRSARVKNRAPRSLEITG